MCKADSPFQVIVFLCVPVKAYFYLFLLHMGRPGRRLRQGERPPVLHPVGRDQEDHHQNPGDRLRDTGPQKAQPRNQQPRGQDFHGKLNAAGDDRRGFPPHGLHGGTQAEQHRQGREKREVEPQAEHRVLHGFLIRGPCGDPHQRAAEDPRGTAGKYPPQQLQPDHLLQRLSDALQLFRAPVLPHKGGIGGGNGPQGLHHDAHEAPGGGVGGDIRLSQQVVCPLEDG